MSNYTDKVNERAEEFAQARHKWIREESEDLRFMPKLWEYLGVFAKNEAIKEMIPLAKLSVQHESEAVRAVFDNYLTDEKVIEIYLQSQGLIETT